MGCIFCAQNLKPLHHCQSVGTFIDCRVFNLALIAYTSNALLLAFNIELDCSAMHRDWHFLFCSILSTIVHASLITVLLLTDASIFIVADVVLVVQSSKIAYYIII